METVKSLIGSIGKSITNTFKRAKRNVPAPEIPKRVITDQTQLTRQELRDLHDDAIRVMHQHGHPGRPAVFISVGAALHNDDASMKHNPKRNQVCVPYKVAKRMSNPQGHRSKYF